MSLYFVSPKVIGYHGTYPVNVDGILESNFFETTDHKIWLGDGTYFFVDGIGSQPPEEYARQFAIDQAYDRDSKKYLKTEYSVLQATIKINENKYLNLTDERGSKLFNEFRDKAIAKVNQTGKEFVGIVQDVDILRVMRESLGIEFVKSNVYIKFAVQRILRFESIIPNVTVLVVNNPSKNIHKSSIKEIKRGEIS